MCKILEKQARVKLAGQWRVVDVLLTSAGKGRKRVEYVDAEGYTLHTEPFSRSKYKDTKIDE